jgi:hypothetical protein
MNKQTEDMILTQTPLMMELDGKEYKAKQLSDADYAELEEWLRQEYLRIVRSACSGSSPQERQEIIDIALTKMVNLSWMSHDALGILSSTNGRAKVAYLMVREHHPNVTIEQLRKTMTNPSNVINVTEAFNTQLDWMSAVAEESVSGKQGNAEGN